jgi:hypothetical protein
MTTLRRDFLPHAQRAADAIEDDLRRAAGAGPRAR